MPNFFEIFGAKTAKPVRYAPLWQSRWVTGMWTQRSPLRDAASSRVEERFYGPRADAFIAGLNVEVSNRLTPVRRAGSTVYNSQTFGPIDSFYSFRLFDSNTETIRVIVDTANTVYDGTGPNTKKVVISKPLGGQAYFQSVGNTLYIGQANGQFKWIQSLLTWQPHTNYSLGQYLIDPAGNIQIVRVAGISGGAQPSWNPSIHGTTVDGSITWYTYSSSIENWGIVAPTTAPTVSPVAAPPPTGYVTWTPNAYYSTTGQGNNNLVVILDSNNNIQRLQGSVGEPQTGGVVPVWNLVAGGTTPDGTITWLNTGSANWVSAHSYFVGDVVVGSDGFNNYFFRCTTAGTSGAFAPGWSPNLFTTISDNTVIWTNIGIQSTWADIGATTFVIGQNGVIDSNGNYQGIYFTGVSGATQPSWAPSRGATTVDNTATWVNQGPYAPSSTGVWKYVYCYKNSLLNVVSSASPASLPIVQNVGQNEQITGAGSTDPQVDTIVLFRTVQDGSVYFEVAEFPNPLFGNWTYIDSTPDNELNNLISAPIAHENDPPPVGLGILTYHLGRIWGALNNTVYFSGGPDTTTGNGDEAFPPANVFVFPDKVNRLFPSPLGLFVFTVSDVYLIQGTKTADFFSLPFLTGLGLQNYNAFDVNGATIYLFTSDSQVVSLDMSSGVSEIGFPIGDQFLQGSFNPASARVSWHIAGSRDKGLYVSDGTTGWFRLYPTPAPETGQLWAPFAAIQGGCSAVDSIETTPGIHNLLIGPASSGPILKRDSSVFTDNGVAYNANFTQGSIVVAQPGQLAELVFVTTDAVAIGNRPTISIQLDEIAPFSSGMFEPLTNRVPDPPQLAASTSLYSDRYYISATTQPALCRHFQVSVDWGIQTVQNELLTMTFFGGYEQDQ